MQRWRRSQERFGLASSLRLELVAQGLVRDRSVIRVAMVETVAAELQQLRAELASAERTASLREMAKQTKR